jgi:hypothetical protein
MLSCRLTGEIIMISLTLTILNNNVDVVIEILGFVAIFLVLGNNNIKENK